MPEMETPADMARDAFYAFASCIFEREVCDSQSLMLAKIFSTDDEMARFEKIETEYESGAVEEALIEALYFIRDQSTIH